MRAGESMSVSQRDKLVAWNTGRKMSDEARAKMRLAAETRSKVSRVCVVCSIEFTAGSGNAKYCELHTNVNRRRAEEITLALTEICDLCFSKADELMVDHCHTCGMLRGILCRKCNLGLGWFNDSIECLRAAIQYLELPPRHKSEEERLYSGWRGPKHQESSCSCRKRDDN